MPKNIIFKGSYIFQNILGFYRDFNDIDFNIQTDDNAFNKIYIVREILQELNDYGINAIIREKKSFYQWSKCFYEQEENKFLKLECLVVAPDIIQVEELEIHSPARDESVIINIPTLEKMFVDKYFSLYYLLSEFIPYNDVRINDTITDLQMFCRNKRINKFIDDFDNNSAIIYERVEADNEVYLKQFGKTPYSNKKVIEEKIFVLISDVKNIELVSFYNKVTILLS